MFDKKEPTAGGRGKSVQFRNNAADYLDDSEKGPLFGGQTARTETECAASGKGKSVERKKSMKSRPKKDRKATAEKKLAKQKKMRELTQEYRNIVAENVATQSFSGLQSTVLFKLSFFFMLIAPFITFLMPTLGFRGSAVKIGMTYVLVALFWLSLIAAYAMLIFVKLKNAWEVGKLYKGCTDGYKTYRFFGIINFFKNRYAAVADFVFIISTVIFIFFVAFKMSDTVAMSVVLGICILSFNMHVYFNDSIFEYIQKNKSTSKRSVTTNE